MYLKTAIIPKTSKLSRDMKKFGLSMQQVVEQYRQARMRESDIKEIVESHYCQQEALKQIKKIFSFANIIEWADCSKEAFSKFKVVIALGGDNHFQYVARFLDHQIIFGVNSDPARSNGALLNFRVEDLEMVKKIIKNGQVKTEQWTRLQVHLNGELLPYCAVSEIYAGESNALRMSRHILRQGSFEEKQRGAGILISTGSGLSGWARGIISNWSPKILKQFPQFPRTAVKGRFFLQGGFDGKKCVGDIGPKNTLTLLSLNSEGGIISFDPDPNQLKFSFPFSKGYQADISLAINFPLVVAVK